MISIDTNGHHLESRIDAAGWGTFFVMSGAVLLVPGVPDGTWLAGVGAILLAFSVARWHLALPVSTFAVILGVVLVASGAGAMTGIAVPGFSLLLVACGVALIAAPLVRRHPRLA